MATKGTNEPAARAAAAAKAAADAAAEAAGIVAGDAEPGVACIAQWHVHHDGRMYGPGEPIELPAAAAELMLAGGSVRRADDAA